MRTLQGIKIPDRVSVGDEVKAEDHNAVLAALQDIIKLAVSAKTQSSADIGVARSEAGGQTLFIKKISRGGGSVATIPPPWTPSFFTTGTEPSLVYKCRFNLGTVNNVAASNWNAEHVLPSAEDTFKFVVLTITSANGKVSGVAISVDAASPATDAVSKDVPPGTQKILLGAIGRSSAKMILVKNLQMAGVEVFRETKSAPAVGAEPFSRWWRWEYSTV